MQVWHQLRAAMFRLTLATVLGLSCGAGLAPRALGERLNFNGDWRFTKSDPADAAKPAGDDHEWSVVSVPHTFNDTDTFNHFALPALRGELDQWSGRTWYRKTFTVPEAWRGKKVYIEFQAVRQFGEVWLNGERLGICKNGFIPFGFDLTPHLKIGAANVLAVMCDNRFLKNPLPAGGNGAPGDSLAAFETKVNAQIPEDVEAIQASQIPWNCPQWHPAMGGIYRDVTLYVTDPLQSRCRFTNFCKRKAPMSIRRTFPKNRRRSAWKFRWKTAALRSKPSRPASNWLTATANPSPARRRVPQSPPAPRPKRN